jgi:hypothetical protein
MSIFLIVLNVKHTLQLLARYHILLPSTGALPERVRGLVPAMRHARHTVIMYALSKILL